MSPPVTPERTVSDVRADLDLDDALNDAVPPPPCEIYAGKRGGPRCGRPASWLAVPACGCAGVYYCAPCRDLLELNILHGARVKCGQCRAAISIDWRAV